MIWHANARGDRQDQEEKEFYLPATEIAIVVTQHCQFELSNVSRNDFVL